MPGHIAGWVGAWAIAGVVACSGGSATGPGELAPISLAADPRPPSVRTQVDRLVQPLVDHGQIVGAAVALFHDGEVEYMGYGRVAADDPNRPAPDTFFEIGAIGQVFTGLLLADFVVRGELDVDTPLQELLPGLRVPVAPGPVDGTPDGRSPDDRSDDDAPVIVLDHLITHTSGLPALSDIAPSPSGDLADLYAAFTEIALYRALARIELLSAPGETYRPSDFAAGLLGSVLARVAESTYEALVIMRLLGPLAMTSTVFELQSDQTGRLALGHDREGALAPAWDYAVALRGAGGWRSTTRDLARLLKAHLELSSTELGPVVSLAEIGRYPALEEGSSLGLGWHIDPRGVRWRSGQTGGYTGYVAYDRRNDTAVVVLCNTASPLTAQLGRALLQGLRGQWKPLELPAK